MAKKSKTKDGGGPKKPVSTQGEDPAYLPEDPDTTGEDPAGSKDKKDKAKGKGRGKSQGSGSDPQAVGKSSHSQSMAPHDRPKAHGKRTKPIKNQCTGTSRQTGNRCELAATKGLDKCRFHGGGGEKMKHIGSRREAKRKALIQASRLVSLDGVDMDPIDHLLDSLYRASQLVNVYAIMCAEIDAGADEQLSDEQTRGELGYEIVSEEEPNGRVIERFIVRSREKLMALNKHSEAQLHPFLVAYTEALRDRARFAKMAIDAGIAEMQTQLVERQVDMAQEALEAAIGEMALDKPARQKFVASYARNLREISTRGSSVPAALLGTGT
jgi:hypothetical protein